jgi:hypothetical protein
MCDCSQCNATEEDNDLYIEWMYDNYRKTTDNPLPINEWLKQFESPRQK